MLSFLCLAGAASVLSPVFVKAEKTAITYQQLSEIGAMLPVSCIYFFKMTGGRKWRE
jgi:hypothetical protein